MARTSFAALVGAALLAGVATVVSAPGPAQAQVVGVSWSNFQEERWKTDEAAIDRKSTRLNSSHRSLSRMPSSA